MADRKHHSQLAVADIWLRKVDFTVRSQGLLLEYRNNAAVKVGRPSEKILRFIFGHVVQPRRRIFRKTLVAPRLCSREECFPGDVLRRFHLIEAVPADKDRYDLSIFGPEQMRDEIAGFQSYEFSFLRGQRWIMDAIKTIFISQSPREPLPPTAT